MKPFISICITCYNSEKYIEKLVDSIYRTNKNLVDFEVVAYNDASKDNTQVLLEQYASRYGNFRVLYDGINRGMVGAKDFVLYNANGRYLWLIDHDDEIGENAIKTFKLVLENNDYPDVLVFKYGAITPDKKYENLNWGYSKAKERQIYDGVYAYLHFNIHCLMYICLYNADFLNRNNIHCDSRPDDLNFINKVFAFAKKVTFLDKQMYYWRTNLESESRDKEYIKKVIPWMTKGLKLSTEWGIKDSNYVNFMVYTYIHLICDQTYMAIMSGCDATLIKNTFYDNIAESQKYAKDVCKSYFSIWDRKSILIKLYSLNPVLFCTIYMSMKQRRWIGGLL